MTLRALESARRRSRGVRAPAPPPRLVLRRDRRAPLCRGPGVRRRRRAAAAPLRCARARLSRQPSPLVLPSVLVATLTYSQPAPISGLAAAVQTSRIPRAPRIQRARPHAAPVAAAHARTSHAPRAPLMHTRRHRHTSSQLGSTRASRRTPVPQQSRASTIARRYARAQSRETCNSDQFVISLLCRNGCQLLSVTAPQSG